jgi:PTH1 family peptidyl-tRNA hydrolase
VKITRPFSFDSDFFDMRLIIGLGNPGSSYQNTRHNAGFLFIDQMAKIYGVQMKNESKFFAEVGRVRADGADFWLLKPLTFMNESGKSVSSFCRFYDIDVDNFIVAHDELDLSPGIVKIKRGGGAGGHNGLKDIISSGLGGDFWRLRIGIGHPGDKRKVSGYVLQSPSQQDFESIFESIERVVAARQKILQSKLDDAMLELHSSNPR